MQVLFSRQQNQGNNVMCHPVPIFYDNVQQIPNRCAVPYCDDDAFAADWAESSAPKEWNGVAKGKCQYLGVKSGAPPSCERYQVRLRESRASDTVPLLPPV